MTTRDRTAEFLNYRANRPRRPEREQLIEEEAEMQRVYISPAWVTKMDDVRRVEDKIREQMENLEGLRKNHLKVEFSSTRDEGEEEAQIDRAQDVIDSLFKQSEKGIKELDAAYLSDLPDGGTDAELSILRNVKMCLVNEINVISKEYRESQRRYMTDVKKQQAVSQRWAGGDRQKVIEQQLENDALMDQYLQKGMTQDQIETIMLNQQMADERVKEFERIYSSIKSLHEMFKDLNTLVIEQGALLDRIDYNMTVTHSRVEKGKQELIKAAKYQSAGTFKILVLFMIILIIGLMVALFFKVVL
ncbi:syntaxin 16 [Angomonas deanei]|uniref:SNARE domain containing protein, putative n=1 Tax=Angomonas deanei TaxID=59799 RepID=S9VR08_9TRYP|nr:syntaxin 16 [Angomonas deanei]EPY38269.1 syntaxin 16 [Angomonas deanei]EPY43324.1 syntaxin 16 [Angomonas deanei]EPY43820.1 syntaxin 16 [Angomonas deanei]CAD2216764.1 SNARE domain containing protein, putative [Angomonas deanei]|eukprot:EPY25852.1 syntaxin 16 [Angomonas deanei]